ncbi:GTP-binding protein [Sphingomonas sp. MMS24-JH45]
MTAYIPDDPLGHPRLSRKSRGEVAAAVHHLQRGRREVDADRAAAVQFEQIFEDQLSTLEADSKRVGTQGQNIDFALLVDGLAAERRRGSRSTSPIVSFATEKRKFIVADTPGHEQYRDVGNGASTADLAVILVDARKGVLTQTRRHSYLAHLLGVRNIVLAIDKRSIWSAQQGRLRPHPPRLSRLRERDRHHRFQGDPGVGAGRRQYCRAERQHGLV